jgi:hypothetical protein
MDKSNQYKNELPATHSLYVILILFTNNYLIKKILLKYFYFFINFADMYIRYQFSSEFFSLSIFEGH